MSANESARLEYLKSNYEPVEECVTFCNFKCDFRIDDESDECPCQWALSKERKQYFIDVFKKGHPR